MVARPRGRLVLVLTILALAGGAAATVPFFLSPPSFLDLMVFDDHFRTDLSGRMARLVDLDRGSEWSLPLRGKSGRFGSDRLRLSSGPARLELSVPGFSPATLTLDLRDLAVTRHEVAIMPTFGRLEVSAFDARTADRPLSRRVRISANGKHVESRDGRPVVLDLEPGRYEVTVEAEGYCVGEPQTTHVRAGQTTEVAFRVPPDLSGDERARVLLDWAEAPRDLDAHVLVSEPSRSLGSRHVYYAAREGSIGGAGDGLFASLDVDWVHSEGVETITVYDRVDGVYQYFVHHYAGEGSLGDSNAQVVLLTAGCQRRLYRAPAGCRQKWWYVADVEIEGGEVSIVDRQSCQASQPFPWDRGGKR